MSRHLVDAPGDLDELADPLHGLLAYLVDKLTDPVDELTDPVGEFADPVDELADLEDEPAYPMHGWQMDWQMS